MESSSIDAHDDKGVLEEVIRLLEGFDIFVSGTMLVLTFTEGELKNNYLL